MNISVSHSGSKALYSRTPEIMVCRILMFMWSFGPLPKALSTCPESKSRLVDQKSLGLQTPSIRAGAVIVMVW